MTTIVDRVEVLVDGRNRRAACKEAGIKPQVRRLNGEDPVAFVLSANIHRRHMTKGQRAMAVAMIYPEVVSLRRDLRASEAYLSHARPVLRFTPKAVPCWSIRACWQWRPDAAAKTAWIDQPIPDSEVST